MTQADCYIRCRGQTYVVCECVHAWHPGYIDVCMCVCMYARSIVSENAVQKCVAS